MATPLATFVPLCENRRLREIQLDHQLANLARIRGTQQSADAARTADMYTECDFNWQCQFVRSDLCFFFFFFFWLFRAFVRAVGAARNALALAENAYFYEGFRVLNRWMIDVHDMDEVGALMDLLTQFTRPYPLEKVRINDHDPEGGAIDAHVIEQMREKLVMGGFVHDHGNIYNIPPAGVQGEDD
ncbi:uncharacterized protein LOC115681559 isoform X1 [Syzygium oleosum]|uniref:uncharacterized protein LOC115681559 isoform X1 n=1 Tax=Syzygium oleosum TaxID=219896 RepID=UPI0024B93384|nr:uncharacterized protein LOC115681559 isoform X1 [Syzygium oleosum]